MKAIIRDKNVIRTVTFFEVPDNGAQINRSTAVTNSDEWNMAESDHEDDDEDGFPPPIEATAEAASSSAEPPAPSTPMTSKAAGKRKARA